MTRRLVAVVASGYRRPVDPILATCPDCGADWRLSNIPGPEVFTFTTPPHKILIWRCSCGAELHAWTDRDGNPVSTDTAIRGKET